MLKTKYILTFVALILYRLSTDFVYENVISELFEYQNFFNNPSKLYEYISWTALLISSPLLIKIFFKKGISYAIVSVLILVSYIPTLTMINYNYNYEFSYVVQIIIYWYLLLISCILMPKIRFKTIKLKQRISIHNIILFILSINVLFISWKYTGFRIHLGLFDVYDLRAEARTYEFNQIFGYLLTFSDNILPIGLVYFLNRKKWIISLFLFSVIFLNFGITATKQILFLLIIAVSGFYFIKSLNISKYFIWGFLGLMGIGVLEYFILDSYIISTLSTYRVFFIPAKLHYVYYDFFSNNELDFFRQSFFKYFFESPYKDNIGFLMGYYDIGDFTARANNGLFSDAYLNFGIIGVLIFPLIINLILKIIDGAAHNLNEKYLFIIIVSYSFVLLGLPFSTALFSGGIIPLLVFLYSIPREKIIYINE